jgi:hypothetical protein
LQTSSPKVVVQIPKQGVDERFFCNLGIKQNNNRFFNKFILYFIYLLAI